MQREQVGKAEVGTRRGIEELPEHDQIELRVEALDIRDTVTGLVQGELEASREGRQAVGQIVVLEMPLRPTFATSRSDVNETGNTII